MIVKNIHELEAKAREVFTELGYSKNTARAMLTVARTIIRLHNEQGETQLNGEIVTNFVKQKEIRYQNGEIGRYFFLMHKNTAEYLTQIYDTGTFVEKRRKLLPELPCGFENILADILANEE